MVVDGTSFQVQIHPQVFDDCNDAATKLSGKEIAIAHIFYKFGATPDPSNRQLRVLSAQVDVDKSYVEMPDISWPNMSPAEVGDTQAMTAELAFHERGHLKIAVTSAAEVTAARHTLVVGGDTRVALGALYETLNERQLAYDKLTAHGVHQSRAPEGLRGDDVHLTCRAKKTQ